MEKGEVELIWMPAAVVSTPSWPSFHGSNSNTAATKSAKTCIRFRRGGLRQR